MSSKVQLSTIKLQRREKILDAAQRLFARDGYKATTMEGIAAQGAMSKVTVYSYFNDKDALFAAVAERFVTRLERAVEEGVETKGLLADRIAEGLIAKYRICFDVIRSSRFSSELFSAGDILVAELQIRMRTNVEATLVDAMTEAGVAKKTANDRARLLFAAATGIEDHVHNYDDAVSDMRALVAAIV